MVIVLKKLDVTVQIVALLAAVTSILLGSFLLNFYFIVGGWQIASLLVHHFSDEIFRSSSRRRAYAWSALAALLLVLIATAISSDITIWILFTLLITTPGLAIWYITICLIEIKALNLRELAHMKR